MWNTLKQQTMKSSLLSNVSGFVEIVEEEERKRNIEKVKNMKEKIQFSFRLLKTKFEALGKP